MEMETSNILRKVETDGSRNNVAKLRKRGRKTLYSNVCPAWFGKHYVLRCRKDG